MPNSFTQVFGGTTIYPADVSYLAIALDANISLEWPLEATAGSTVVARIIDITPSGAYTITMPDATAVSVGQTVLFNNIGPSTVAINKADGGGLLSIGAGEQWQAYLIDNSTVGGTWRSLRYGASTAQAQAAALAGPGLVTDGALLAQNYEVIDLSATPYSLTAPDRAKVFVWTGGLGTLNLPPASSAGDGWFVQVRNGGQGDLIIDPSSSELINASSTLRLQPGDSAVVVGDGAQWYTIGFGQQSVFAFDYTSVAVTGGTYTLSGSELNRIAYKFTGTLTSNVTIVVPATVQQYWVNNATTGAFTLSLRASGSGSSTLVTQASTSILYCDGTTIVPATTAVTFAGILPVTQGGTGANNAASARTNLGATGIGSNLFTALTAASARATITAASSGANSDITSLTGLTTPLSVGQGGTGVTSSTGTGSVVLSTSPTLVTPVLGAASATSIAVGLGAVGTPSFTFTGDTNTGIFSPAADTIAFVEGGAEAMRIDSVGNVGIGTVSPGARLHVVNAVHATMFRLQDVTTDATAKFGVIGTGHYTNAQSPILAVGVASQAASSTVFVGGGFATLNSATSIQFYTGANSTTLTGTERMRIDNSGLVGIGTLSPAARLHVVNTSLADQLRLQDVTTDATIKYGVIGTGHYTNAEEPLSMVTGVAGVGSNTLALGGGIGTMNAATVMTFFTAATTTTLIGTERMRITSAGEVCVGRTSSLNTGVLSVLGTGTQAITAQVTVDGNSLIQGYNSSTGLAFQVLGTGQGYYAGNLGIGTTSPAARIHTNGGAGGITAVFESNTAADTRMEFRNNATRAGYLYWDANEVRLLADPTRSVTLFTNGVERMRVNSAGDAGIGTASPSYKLEVRTDAASAFNWVASFNNTAASSFGAGFLARAGANIGYFYMRGDGTAIVENSGAFPLAFSTNSSERMRIDSAGNVGIGTSSPGTRLDVTGTTRSGNFRVNAGGTVTGAGMWGIDTILAFNTDSLERMRITAAGDVGIGASVPSAKLEVARTDAAAGIRVTVGSGAYSGQVALFGVVGVSNGFYITKDASNNIQHIWDGTSGSERMRLDSAGNLGIGTNSPAARIHIVNSGLAAQLRLQDTETNATRKYGVIGSGHYTNAEEALSVIVGDSSLTSNDVLIGGGVSTMNAATSIRFFTAANSTTLVGTERMQINASGNVGIATAPSGVRLDVNGSIRTTVGSGGTLTLFETDATRANQLFSGADASGSFINATFSTGGSAVLRLQTANNERMRITAAGDVGIGVSNPGALLHAAGITRISDATNSTAVTIDAVTTAGLTSITAQFGGSELALGSAATERMRVKAGGQVRFVPLAAAPASPQAGDVYYDSTTNKLRCYNGTTWNDLF